MIIAKNNSENKKDFDMIPAGTHAAVCYGVWDIGMQTMTWNGEEKKMHKIIIGWEIKETNKSEGDTNGKRYVISLGIITRLTGQLPVPLQVNSITDLERY